MASMAAFVYFWSSAYEVSGGCATDTLYPSFLRILAPGSQPEPSANAPCTRTTFLMTPSRFDSILPPLIFGFRFSIELNDHKHVPVAPRLLRAGSSTLFAPLTANRLFSMRRSENSKRSHNL